MNAYDYGIDVPDTLADAAHKAHARGDTAVQHACEDAALRLALQTPAGRGGGSPRPAGLHRIPDRRTDPR